MNIFKIPQILDVALPDTPTYNSNNILLYAILGLVVVAVVVGTVVVLKNKNKKEK
ncbi:MAG: hypothetical protein IK997_00010 [Bacilli bacterium]|nr:hypothetical protein [Bacilli bacterium]